jgi:tRNA(fMet)-specific endonuclease VapC
MKYLLDTNVCIKHLNQRSEPIIRTMSALPTAEMAVCSIVKAELFYGAAKARNPELTLAKQQEFLNRFASLPFDDKAAATYATIRANLEATGTPIGPNDLMIAAIAIANNLALVTHNTGEFSRVEGLKIVDWESGGRE